MVIVSKHYQTPTLLSVHGAGFFASAHTPPPTHSAGPPDPIDPARMHVPCPATHCHSFGVRPKGQKHRLLKMGGDYSVHAPSPVIIIPVPKTGTNTRARG